MKRSSVGGFDSGPADLQDKNKITGGRQIAVRGEWAQFAITTGRYYYQNTTTGETTWELPSGFKVTSSRRAGDVRSGDASSLRNKLFVFNVPPNWDEDRLMQRFQPFGQITGVTVQRDAGGQHKGCGFVTFSAETESQAAINSMNGYFIDGMRLRVAPSRY